MKFRSVSPAALALAAPLLMILALLLPLACGSSSSGATSSTPQPTTAQVLVGLVDAPSLGFQNILLNVISIRLNTVKNATDATKGWVSIPAPTGVGGPVGAGIVITNLSTGGQFFNTNNPDTNPGPSELQIDLNNLQDNVMLFNTAGVPPQTYHTVQLKIDPNVPGSIVPNCQSAPSGTEGCVTFPLKIAGSSTLTFSTPIPVIQRNLTPVVLEISLPNPPTPPNTNGGKYTIAPQILLVPNSAASPSVNSLMALVQGSVTGVPAGAKEVVTAEPAGTSNQIATAKVKNGKYTMQLPVALNGTSYDFFAFGAGNTYDVLPPLPPAPLIFNRGDANIGGPFNLTVKSVKTGVLSGTISDACLVKGVALPVEGATVELLAPTSNTTVCTDVPTPPDCVVVAITSTNTIGVYPTPGRSGMPQPFNFVPSSPNSYALRVSASGFDTVTSPFMSTGGKVTCSNHKCNFALTHAMITGTVSIAPVSGITAEVQVFAEAHGTNDIVSALPVPVSIPSCMSPPCSQPFTLNVPVMPGTYDVFASSIDLFNGAPDPYSSHDFSVFANVTPPGACEAAAITVPQLACAGHGSISGSVSNPFDIGTTVRLIKDGVQVAQTPVGAFGTSNANAYSFCAPSDPDNYQVERAENDVLVPPAVDVTVPMPTATSTPSCPLCTTTGGLCPGNCVNTDGPTL